MASIQGETGGTPRHLSRFTQEAVKKERKAEQRKAKGEVGAAKREAVAKADRKVLGKVAA